MNSKKFLISWLAVFVTIFVVDMIFHGRILGEMYRQTANLWRPKEEMCQFMPWLTLGSILWSGAFSYLFLTGYQGRGVAAGIRYGVLISLLFVAHDAVMYAVAPYPPAVPCSWAIGNIIEFAIAGAVLGFINKV